MFAYPFRLLSLSQVEGGAAEGTIELAEDFSPAINSLVALDLFTEATHTPFFVSDLLGNRVVAIRCRKIQIYDPFAISRYISSERWFNLGDVDQHELDCAKHLHEFYNELTRAEKAHPHWNRDAVYAAGILGEEAGETLQAALDYQQDPNDCDDLKVKISEEAVQTGAMALRLLINADGFEHASKSLCVSQVSTLSEMLNGNLPAEEIVAALSEMIRKES